MTVRKTAPEPQPFTEVPASAAVPEGGILARAIGDVVAALGLGEAELEHGVTVTVKDGIIHAVGKRAAE